MGAGPGAARNTPFNASRPVGPRPQEASEARGCTQALDAGQADGRLRECGPGLGLKPGSEVGPRPGWSWQAQSHQGCCAGASSKRRHLDRATSVGFTVRVFVNSVRVRDGVVGCSLLTCLLCFSTSGLR